MKPPTCIVGGIYPPDSGGPSKFAFEFQEFLSPKTIQLHVLVTKEGKSDKCILSNGEIIRISRELPILLRVLKFLRELRKIDKSTSHFLVVGAFFEVFLARLKKSSRIIYKLPGDVVWERARNNGVTDRGVLEFQTQSLPMKYKILRKISSSAIRAADEVIVPSENLRELTKIWGVRQDKVHLVHNSVLVSEFSRSHNLTKSIDVLTVCRLTPWKGVDELIRSAHELNLSLTVVGDGPEMSNLVSLAKSLGANVNFLGQIKQSEVFSVLAKSKRFVLNSQYEGLPHVLLEARASGVLCLAREGTGSSEVISHLKDGLLFGPSSGFTLTQALDYSFSNAIDENEMVTQAALDVRSRFNQNVNFEQIKEILYAD